MRGRVLLGRAGGWVVIVLGVLLGLGVLFDVHDDHGFGWAALAFAAVVAPCVIVARWLWADVRRRAAVAHGRPLAEGEARYCARCGMETRTFDTTCTFCGGTRFVAERPGGGEGIGPRHHRPA